MEAVFRAEDIVGGYGKAVVVQGVTMDLRPKELVALVGPNGSGKSTFIKSVWGLAHLFSGHVYLDGEEITRLTPEQKSTLGIQFVPQVDNTFPDLRVRENLEMGAYLSSDPAEIRQTMEGVFDTFPILEERKEQFASTLSGGERQMLAIGRALMSRPTVLFLDEPTVTMDVPTARELRRIVKEMNDAGKTILYTTHLMHEAEELCDRVAIIDHGRILACDTPENLKRTIRHDTTFRIEVDTLKSASALSGMKGVKNFSKKDDASKNTTSLTFILEDEAAVSDILSAVQAQGAKIHYLQKSEPTLEDVFISMVGRGLE